MVEKRARASALAVESAPSPSEEAVEHATPEQAAIERGAAEHADLYARLATPFEVTFRDLRGGVELEYITGEQCVTRLNETLGVANWNFRVLEHGIHSETDECWVLGELTATIGDKTVTRQQFGSQKVKRSRASGTPLDIGFDFKGAATDALKKCASLLGVALYLWKKEVPAEPTALQPLPGRGADSDGAACEECGEPLAEVRFKDGTSWPPTQLASYGRRKHSRVLCMSHYREANEAKRRAEAALQQVPF